MKMKTVDFIDQIIYEKSKKVCELPWKIIEPNLS